MISPDDEGQRKLIKELQRTVQHDNTKASRRQISHFPWMAHIEFQKGVLNFILVHVGR